MPFPSANSYTQTKWLAFFAELTAKLTHHNVLVVMEGAELLKRLLISRVSIAAILQQGELLVRLLDCWRGCVTAAHPSTSDPNVNDNGGAFGVSSPSSSAAVALNDELSFVLAESISQCVDLMWSLYADGDPYYCLLVLARAGPMLEVLVDVLQTAPPQLYGITANLLQQLLSLPLGHSEVEMVTDGEGERFVGLDKATVEQLRKSVALRRHIRTLVEAVQEHAALLQHAADVMAGLLAVQQGPRCLAAVSLFNLASKRQRKFELRHGHASTVASPSPSMAGCNAYAGSDVADSANDNSELNVTITGAPQAAFAASPPSKGKASRGTASALDDLEKVVESSASDTTSAASPKTTTTATTKTAGAAAAAASPSSAATPAEQNHASSDVAEATSQSKERDDDAAPQDISAVVDAEPVRYTCSVPPSLAEEAMRHLSDSHSHEAFFDALDWLWCLTVADPAVVGTALTPHVFTQGLGRYLKAAPRTRRDRMLFTLLLLWLGHLHSISVLRRDTHRCLLDVAARSLLPMLRAELSKDEHGGVPSKTAARRGASTSASLNVSAITPTDGSASGVTSAMALAASTGYSLPNADLTSFSAAVTAAGLPSLTRDGLVHGTDASWSAVDGDTARYEEPPRVVEATLLPYAAARKAQEAALLLRPSIEVILLSFLLNVYVGIDAAAKQAWVCDGRVLDVALAAVRRASGVRSALLDTPSTIDGALSDEVYLDYALRSVRTDATTVAVLGCRLMAAVLGSELRWGMAWRDARLTTEPETKRSVRAAGASAAADTAVEAEMALFTQSTMPLLVHIAVNNPDVAAAQEGGAASPVHYVPANLRCTRYTSLGESSLVALDACLQFYAQGGHLRSRGEAATTAVGDTSRVAIEDLVRVLPALARVSHDSVHPPVRAVPYRCLLYISRRIEDVLVVLRDMPSLANAAVSCVLDYGATSSQWEVAAAAEWLTVLVDLLTEAEMKTETTTTTGEASRPPDVDITAIGGDVPVTEAAKRQRHFRLFLSPAAQLQEYFHFDDSPLARKLLPNVATGRRRSTGSAYAMSALLQLTVHLQLYMANRQRLRDAQNRKQQSRVTPQESKANPSVDEAVTQPLLPTGLSSIAQWILLLQSTTADNTRLTRICAAFQRAQEIHKTEENRNGAASAGISETGTTSTPAAPRAGRSRPILKDASARALTAAEQIALQFTFSAALFRALHMVLTQHSPSTALYGKQFSNTLLCHAVAAAVALPSPREVTTLLSMRFHAPTTATSKDDATASFAFSSTALLFGYQAVVQWACCVGAGWMRGTYPCCTTVASEATTKDGAASALRSGGGLPTPCPAALVEALCGATEAIMRDTDGCLSQRTRCEAAALLSAVVEACPADHLPILEAHGAALFAASTALRRAPCVSGLQCRLLRRVWRAARYACSTEHNWLRNNLQALKETVEQIKEYTPAVQQSATTPRNSSPRRNRSASRQQQRLRSPGSRETDSMARDLQVFQVLTAVLTSLVACVGEEAIRDSASSPLLCPPFSSSATAVLLTPSQRQTLCATLCDALRVASLHPCVLASLKSMSGTAEGRRCLLTDISSAGDPLGRTLFGRVLALTLHIPCRWAGPNGTSNPPPVSSHHSPSISPRAQSPSASPPHSPFASAGRVSDADGDVDSVVAAGCDICAALLGRVDSEEGGAAVGEVVDGTPASDSAAAASRVSTSSFLASFMKHRGLDYLARAIVASDQQHRRQGRPLTVPLPLLRLLSALSLQHSVVKDIVRSADLFSVLLELAGVTFPPHSMTATLALLALRNVCFDGSLKSTLCQDARVLLTLKAAALKLSCVCQLVEDTSASAARPANGSAKVAGNVNASRGQDNGNGSSSRSRRARVEVALRDDVVDPENPATVTWAKQMCVYARTRRASPTTERAAEPAQQHNNSSAEHTASTNKEATAAMAAERRTVFGDITNTSPHPVADASTLSSMWQDNTETVKLEMATDVDAERRQYLAATALASLWFDNQRGKAAIMEALSASPSCDMEEMQALAQV